MNVKKFSSVGLAAWKVLWLVQTWCVCVCVGGVFTYDRVQKSLVFLNFSTLLCFETRFLTEGLAPGLARLAGR